MTIYMEGAVAHLNGDLTHSGMSQSSIKLLSSSLEQIESDGGDSIRIDCEMVSDVDISGLQLLDVWMQCARFMGVEPVLVNMPNSMQSAFL